MATDDPKQIDTTGEPAMTDEQRWGEPITPERQAELQGMLDAWNAPGADHDQRQSPFDGVHLTGAEVSWLAEQSGRTDYGRVPNLHLEGALLSEAHLAPTSAMPTWSAPTLGRT
jgi:hypothetical protein